MEVEFSVNGVSRAVDVEPRTTLADALRDGLGLTGTRLGCEHGVCGSCTILLDGVPARACLLLAVQCAGAAIGTVEGLGWPGPAPAAGAFIPAGAAGFAPGPDADDPVGRPAGHDDARPADSCAASW